MCSKLQFLKVSIFQTLLKRKNRIRASPSNSDSQNVDHVMQPFERVPGAKNIVVLSDDWLGMHFQYRKARADAEELQRRIRDHTGMS